MPHLHGNEKTLAQCQDRRFLWGILTSAVQSSLPNGSLPSFTYGRASDALTFCVLLRIPRLRPPSLAIEEGEAAIVRLIFALYLDGKSRREIAKYLSEMEVPTRQDVFGWKESTVSYILNNERYAGNALLAKKITTDDFPRKKVRNHGEREQYYVSNSHPAILPSGIFEKTQALSKRRITFKDGKTVEHPLRKIIRCNKCGSIFKRRNTGGNEYWVCTSHFENRESCSIQQIPGKEFEKAIRRLYYTAGSPPKRKIRQTATRCKRNTTPTRSCLIPRGRWRASSLTRASPAPR